MRIRYVFLFIMVSQSGISQVTLPPFYGLLADATPVVLASPVGGNAICNGSAPTPVVPITSVTGIVWMDRNLGASRAATSSTDYEAYGCLYQWGRGNDGHASVIWSDSTTGTPVNGSTATLAATDTPGNALFITTSATPNDWRSNNNSTRWQGIAGTNNPCPSGYRVPTDAEFTAETDAYGITDSNTAYTNGPGGGFKFVPVGSRSGNSVAGSGFAGKYWSSSISGSGSNYRFFTPAGSSISIGTMRSQGYSVRCIKDPTSLAICDGNTPTPVVPIVSSTGRTWMDRNLGASRAAKSATDFEAYGCLYQWGRGNDGHASIAWTSSSAGTAVNGTTATLATTDTPGNELFITISGYPSDWRSDNNNTRWQGSNGTNNPCPSTYRIPTDTEFAAEFAAYSIINSATAYTNGPTGGFKFAASGMRFRNSTAQLSFQATNGYFWTSTPSSNNAIIRTTDSGGTSSIQNLRADGFSVRCIKDLVLTAGNAICDGTQPTTVVPITSSTGRIWMDRNLGASRAATSATDYQAYGCLYQWGRGNDGHASINWTSSTAGTPVNGSTTTLSATNTPANALFIMGDATNGDWRSAKTNTLWQGLTGINNPCPAGYRLPNDTEVNNEVTSYNITTSATAYSSPLRFPYPGVRVGSTSNMGSTGTSSFLWTSTINGVYAFCNFWDSVNPMPRAYGFTVRCIHD